MARAGAGSQRSPAEVGAEDDETLGLGDEADPLIDVQRPPVLLLGVHHRGPHASSGQPGEPVEDERLDQALAAMVGMHGESLQVAPIGRPPEHRVAGHRLPGDAEAAGRHR